MAEPGRDADLAEEAIGTEHRTELGVEHLERHLTLMAEVFGQVDRGHASAPQLALEYVPIRQGGRQSRGNVAQRGSELGGNRRGGRIHCGPWTRNRSGSVMQRKDNSLSILPRPSSAGDLMPRA